MAIWYVDASVTELATVPQASAFKTIGEALLAASNSEKDTIIVRNGTYNENLVIDRAVELVSEKGVAGTPEIVGSVTPGSLGTIHVLPGVNNVTIGGLDQGFKIVGYDALLPGIENATVYLQGAHNGITIQGNEIESNGEGGLLTEYGQSVTHLIVDFNIFSGQTFVGEPATGNQFVVPNVPRSLVFIGTNDGSGVANNVTFSNNQITGRAGGLTADDLPVGNTLVTIDAADLTVSNNTFSGYTTGSGFQLRVREANTELLNNDFNNVDGGNVGLYIAGDAGNDNIIGSEDADLIDGGAGIDTVVYADGAVITHDAAHGRWTVTFGGITDTLLNVEHVQVGTSTYVLVGAGGHSSLNAAIAGAADGNTILVAAGTYNENVLVNKDVTILGGNAGIAGFSARAAESTINGGIHILANGVTLDGLKIVDGGSVGELAGVFVQGNDATITNSHLVRTGPVDGDGYRAVVTAIGGVDDVAVTNNQMSGWATGTYLNPGATGTVTGNVYSGNYVGLSSEGPNGVSISDNTFDGSVLEQVGVGAPGATVDLAALLDDNTFKMSAATGEVFVYGSGDNQSFVSSSAVDRIDGGAGTDDAIYEAGAVIGRDADNNWTVTVGGVTDTLLNVEKVVIGGKTYLLVDSDGDGGYGTVSGAVAAANDDDTILVAAGTYNENVLVNKDVTILGGNAGIAGFSARGAESTIKGGIHILANGVTLDGLKIVDGGSVGELAGVFVQGNDTTITNSLLVRSGPVDGDGSRAVVTAMGGVSDLAVTGNQMTGWATGTYLNPGATGTVTGNLYSGNYVGISLDVSEGVTVTGNGLFGNLFEHIGVGVYAEAIDVSSIVGANTIWSNAPGDSVQIYALGSGQAFQGTIHADTFHGSDGADVFQGGAGDDVIKGGDGDDTAIYDGNRTDYDVTVNSGVVRISDRVNGSGTDFLSDVEFFQFANAKVSLRHVDSERGPDGRLDLGTRYCRERHKRCRDWVTRCGRCERGRHPHLSPSG